MPNTPRKFVVIDELISAVNAKMLLLKDIDAFEAIDRLQQTLVETKK